MNTIVEVKNLVKKFPVGSGFFTALNGINLSFGEGEFAGLVGPSGSGKTTLLNIIGWYANFFKLTSLGQMHGSFYQNINQREMQKL